MSLEEALNRNTAAMERHNDLLEKMLASAGKTGGAAATKPADKAADKAADKPADKKPADKKPAAKALTLESVTETVTAFLKTGDKETRDVRKGQIGTIIEHYGVERFTLIPQESWAEALGYLKDFEAGRTPSFIDENGGEGDDGDGDGDGDDALV